MKTTRTLLAVLTIAGVVGAAAREAPAAPVSLVVKNSGFESYVIGADGFYPTNPDWVNSGSVGTDNPDSTIYTGTTGATAPIPGDGDGYQLGLAYDGGFFYQDLDATLNPGGLNLLQAGEYTLTVAVGNRLDIGPPYRQRPYDLWRFDGLLHHQADGGRDHSEDGDGLGRASAQWVIHEHFLDLHRHERRSDRDASPHPARVHGYGHQQPRQLRQRPLVAVDPRAFGGVAAGPGRFAGVAPESAISPAGAGKRVGTPHEPLLLSQPPTPQLEGEQAPRKRRTASPARRSSPRSPIPG